MTKLNNILIGFSLVLLITCLVFGVVAAIAFFAPNAVADVISFRQARPIHVSAALFWIISAAAGGIIYYQKQLHPERKQNEKSITGFGLTWMLTIVAVFVAYTFNYYGGREYWEFPPFLNLFLLIAWILLIIGLLPAIGRLKSHLPVYHWMWATGILFFLFTFIEQNLWHIPWFRESFLKEMTVQWKSNGSMVGAWNQMIYGTAIYIMVKISGDEKLATSRRAYASYFLGLTNLVFNWGHHIYNVPSAHWIRDVAYLISMTEWVFVISIIQGFRNKLEERAKFRHFVAYRFLVASEFWIFLNLLLALMMSIPAINRYTHGTHITVAHAMGTTIGINTMILLGSISFMTGMDNPANNRQYSIFNLAYWLSQASLLVFWLALIVAGLTKGIRLASSPQTQFTDVMAQVYPSLKIFMYSGIGLAAGLIILAVLILRRVTTDRDNPNVK